MTKDLDEKIRLRKEVLVVNAVNLNHEALPSPRELESYFAMRATIRSMFDVVFVADKNGTIVYDTLNGTGLRGSSGRPSRLFQNRDAH